MHIKFSENSEVQMTLQTSKPNTRYKALGSNLKSKLSLTLNAWRKGFRSFTSFANDTRPSPFPSDAGNTSNTTISKG